MKNLLECGRSNDFGLLLYISIPAIYKRNATGDWGDYCELAGTNFRQMKYSGSDEKIRRDVLKALENAGAAGIVNLPEGVDIEWLKNSSSSSNQLFENFDKAMSNRILKILLGQAITTQSEGGSYARAVAAIEVEKSITDDDKTYILDFLNYSFRPLLSRWGMPDNGRFIFREDTRLTTKEQLENDLTLAKIIQTGGIPVEELEKKYGIKLQTEAKTSENV